MNDSESVGDLKDTTAKTTQSHDQLLVILHKKIEWNQAFSEITTFEEELHGKVNKFTQKQTAYFELVNPLLDSISSGELKLDFSLYTTIQDKYKIVEENVSNFKIKLHHATQEVERGRMKWLDGFLPSQLHFMNKFSPGERKAMVNRCREGDRVTSSTKLMLQELALEWRASGPGLEHRLEGCIREVEDLLEKNLDVSMTLDDGSYLSEA